MVLPGLPIVDESWVRLGLLTVGLSKALRALAPRPPWYVSTDQRLKEFIRRTSQEGFSSPLFPLGSVHDVQRVNQVVS